MCARVWCGVCVRLQGWNRLKMGCLLEVVVEQQKRRSTVSSDKTWMRTRNREGILESQDAASRQIQTNMGKTRCR